MENIPSLKEQKEDILQNFNFDDVAMIMGMPCKRYNDNDKYPAYSTWRMYHPKLGYIQYSSSQLKELADSLLSQVIGTYITTKDNLIYVSTGPFRAEYRYGILELMFIMDSYSYD